MKKAIQFLSMLCALTLVTSCSSITDRICNNCNNETAAYDEVVESSEYEESEFVLLNVSGTKITKEILTELYEYMPYHEEVFGRVYNGRFSKNTKDLVYFTFVEGYLHLNIIDLNNEKYLQGYKVGISGDEVVSVFWKDLSADNEFKDMFHSLIVLTKDSYANSYHTSIVSKDCGNRSCYFFPRDEYDDTPLKELQGVKTYEEFLERYSYLKNNQSNYSQKISEL
jgi:hypothetical protein